MTVYSETAKNKSTLIKNYIQDVSKLDRTATKKLLSYGKILRLEHIRL